MSVADLIRRVSECGFQVVLAPDGPRLRQVAKLASIPPETMAELKARKAEVAVELAEAAWITCRSCGAKCNTADPDAVFAVCPMFPVEFKFGKYGSVVCPFTPDGWAAERRRSLA